jgi:hypothetical protein
MSADKIYLSKEQQIFLKDMLEIEDLNVAAETYAFMLANMGADPGELKFYLEKTMIAWAKRK